MESERLFHVIVSIYLLWHGVWWSKKGLLNLSVKFIFWVLAVWAIILTLHDFGYLVNI